MSIVHVIIIVHGLLHPTLTWDSSGVLVSTSQLVRLRDGTATVKLHLLNLCGRKLSRSNAAGLPDIRLDVMKSGEAVALTPFGKTQIIRPGQGGVFNHFISHKFEPCTMQTWEYQLNKYFALDSPGSYDVVARTVCHGTAGSIIVDFDVPSFTVAPKKN